MIPPFNRMLLEVTFGKLYAWAVQNIRNVLMDANAKFKELGESTIASMLFYILALIMCCGNLQMPIFAFEKTLITLYFVLVFQLSQILNKTLKFSRRHNVEVL